MKSKKGGSERLQKKVLIFRILEKEPGMHAHELIDKMREYGVNLTRSSAYRAIASFKENDNVAGSDVRCLRVVSSILENVPEGEHLTARQIMDKAAASGENVHRSTVYRVLDRLNASTLIQTTRRGRQSYYEWRRGDQHGHLTCIHCNKTIEFKHQDLDEMAKSVCEKTGYEFQRMEFLLRSVCVDCWTEKEAVNAD